MCGLLVVFRYCRVLFIWSDFDNCPSKRMGDFIVAEDGDYYQIDTSIPYYIEDNDGNCVFLVQKKDVIVL